MERGNFDFKSLKFAILDEADVMLNLGFKEDIETIMRTIKEHGPKAVSYTHLTLPTIYSV